jgi:hypothetical protein
MGRSVTPTYRVEVWDGVKKTPDVMAWEGRASEALLGEWVYVYGKSFEHDGVNAQVSNMLGYIPYPTRARIVHQRSGEVKAEWKAAMFQVWTPQKKERLRCAR